MIEVQKQYKLKLTEPQALELYQFLRTQKDVGRLTIDHELLLVYNELRKLFDTGIR